MVGTPEGLGRVYLHAVVDTFGSYAFGFLHVSKQPEAAVAVLHNDVLPFYAELDLPVQAVLTDNGREFCGTERHPYELYLALNDIEHRETKVGRPRANGFVERFNGTVLEEVFEPKMRETFYDSVDALQADLISATAIRAVGPGTRSSCSSAKEVKRTVERRQCRRWALGGPKAPRTFLSPLPQAACAASLLACTTSPSSPRSTRAVWRSGRLPARMSSASGSWTRFWIRRRSGLAP